MSLTWEPRWEPYLVNYAGMRFWTCRDKITKMIACPICINAVESCLKEDKRNVMSTRKKVDIEGAFFFNERDLINHIKSHASKQWIKERKIIEKHIVEEE